MPAVVQLATLSGGDFSAAAAGAAPIAVPVISIMADSRNAINLCFLFFNINLLSVKWFYKS